jgi:glycosyltransferase involved in cell wall biosynthesis
MIDKERIVVSLVMATYNDSPTYLESAINSIREQTFYNWELIIVDDSTKEETKKVLDVFSDEDQRIVIIRSDTEKYGFVKALNVGLENARGDFVGRMDGDDLSRPERIKKEVDFLRTHKEYDVVGSQTSIIDSTGKITSFIKFPATGLKFRLFQIMRCPMQHGTVLMRRTLIDNGVRYDEKFKRSEDLELWLRLQKYGYKLYNLQEVLYDFRVEENYAIKRNKEHFEYNVRARKKNFTCRYFLTNLVGVIVAICYSIIPSEVKNTVYKRLNGR